MGEANRRKAEIAALKRGHAEWLASLTQVEREAAEVADRAFTQIVEKRGLVAGCYLLAFFLHYYLLDRRDITTELVVGWVNDGEWRGVASHAWIELNSKRIDISTAQTENPEAQPPGDLIILDRIVRPGKVKYAYYREPPADAVQFMEESVRSGDFPGEMATFKEREHAKVAEWSRTPAGVAEYLRGLSSDRSFDSLVRMIE